MPYTRDARTECEKICLVDPLVTYTDYLDPGKPRTARPIRKRKVKSKIERNIEAPEFIKENSLQSGKPTKSRKMGILKDSSQKHRSAKKVIATDNITLINPSQLWTYDSSMFEKDEMIPLNKVRTCFTDDDQADEPKLEETQVNVIKYPITEAQRRKRKAELKKEKKEKAEREKREKELMFQRLHQLKETIQRAKENEPETHVKLMKACDIRIGKKKLLHKCPSKMSDLVYLEESIEQEEDIDIAGADWSQTSTHPVEDTTNKASLSMSNTDETSTYTEEEATPKESTRIKVIVSAADHKRGGSLFEPSLKLMYDLWDEIQEKKKTQSNLQNEQSYDHEKLVVSTPKTVKFIDFEYGSVYKTTITLRNMAKSVADCVFYNVSPSYYSRDIKVYQKESLKLASGMSGALPVQFTPGKDFPPEVECRLLFVIRRAGIRRLLPIPVVALLSLPRPRLLTRHVHFPKVQWWMLNDPHLTIDFYNEGARPCRAIIETIKEETDLYVFPEYSGLDGEGGMELETAPPLIHNSECRPEKVASSILDLALDAVFDPFRLRNRLVQLPPRTRISLPIRFDKGYVRSSGILVRRFAVRFEAPEITKPITDEFTLECDVEGSPLALQPYELSYGYCHLDNYSCRKISISNSAKIPYPLSVSIPSLVRNQIFMYPSCPSIQAKSSVDVLIKFLPRLELFKYKDKYFNPSNGRLEFPIKFTPSIPHHGPAPPLVLIIKATVSPALGLQIMPKFIELGVVSTVQAIRHPIFLVNYSKTTQYFAFLNNHPFVEVQPNYGFGVVRSGEKVELEVVYSPKANFLCPWDPARVLLQQQLESTHAFELSVTTLFALARIPRATVIIKKSSEESEDSIETELPARTVTINSSSSSDGSSKQLELNRSKSLTRTSKLSSAVSFPSLQTDDKEGMAVDRRVDPFKETMDSNFDILDATEAHCQYGETLPILQLSVYRELGFGEERTERESRRDVKIKRITARENVRLTRVGVSMVEDRKPEMEASTLREGNERFHKVRVRAFVSRTFYELSHQFICLEPCPIYSHRILSFYLKVNSTLLATIKEHPDSTLAYKHQNVHVRFEFFSSDSQIQVQPKSGMLRFGQDQKLFLIFRPILSPKRISDHVMETQDSLGISLDFNSGVVFTDEDLNDTGVGVRLISRSAKFSTFRKAAGEAKIAILSSMDIEPLDVRIRCLIQYRVIAQFPATTLEEVHDLEVRCASKRPDIVVPLDNGLLDFGRVAVGSHIKKFIMIRSLANGCIFAKITHVDPSGPFHIPIVHRNYPKCSGEHPKDSFFIDEGKSFELPVIFTPETPNKPVHKFFEVISGLTNIPIQLKGVGVLPVLECIPEFTSYITLITYKTRKEIIIILRNLCDASLNISFNVDFIKEGILPAQFVPRSKTRKVPTTISRNYDPSYYEAVFGHFKDTTNDQVKETLIQIYPEDEINLDPGKKAEISLNLYLDDKVPRDRHLSRKSRKSEADFVGLQLSYAIRVQVLLDMISLLKDWLIIVVPTRRNVHIQ